MATRNNTPETVQELIWNEYCSTVRYQRAKNDIKVTMSFDEYLGLWSLTRINSMAKKIALGQKSIDYYMGNEKFRPVCGWVDRDRRVPGGTMTVADAKIMSAEDSRRMFQFQPGDKHREESKARIGDSKRGIKQSAEHVKKRTAGQVGKKRGPMSDAAKEKLRATRAANRVEVPHERPADHRSLLGRWWQEKDREGRSPSRGPLPGSRGQVESW